MAFAMRLVRQIIPGVVYHLISRFVDRDWFFSDDEERDRYLFLFGRAIRDSDWRCTAYALMSSHIHIATIAGAHRLESWIKRVHSPFAIWMNQRRNRLGPMFVRGPSDYALPPDRHGALIAYLHNNPVRAGVVKEPSASTWTSHRAYVGLARPQGWLSVELGISGFTRGSFAELVASNPDDPSKVDLAGVEHATRRRGAIELATPTAGEQSVIPLVARPAAHVRVDPRAIVQVTAGVVKISELQLCSRQRIPVVVLGRRLAIHAARRLAISGSDIAAALGLSPSAVSRVRTAEPELRPHIELIVERVSAFYGISFSTTVPNDR
jgi:hypothetical protein